MTARNRVPALRGAAGSVRSSYRPVLYAAVEVEEIQKIISRVNPWLLEALDDRLDEEDTTDYENLSYGDAGPEAVREPNAAESDASGATSPGDR